MTKLDKRILQISKKHQLTHIGSNLSAVSIIDHIYKIKKDKERFVLSCGHSGLALYVVLEKYLKLDAEKILADHGIHATRCADCQICCSTGSLGNGLPIALGMALSDRTQNVYCLISDGECMEGSIWETLRIADELGAYNLKVYVNANGWGGLKSINEFQLKKRLESFFPVEFVFSQPRPFPGLLAHYQKI